MKRMKRMSQDPTREEMEDLISDHLEIESALDSGRLQIRWSNGKWYAVRRNGQTKTWKRDSQRFSIPCKTGFRECFRIAPDLRDGDLKPDNLNLRVID